MKTKPPLALGTANLGAPYGVVNDPRGLSSADVDDLLCRTWARGIRLLDTASGYKGSENRIGAHIGRWDHGFDVVSKSPPLSDVPGAEIRQTLTGHCAASLNRLGLKRLRGYLLHDADDIVRPGVADALARLKEAGMSEAVGVSIYQPEQGFAALATGVVDILQVPVNALDRRFVTSGLADACGAAGVAVHARSIYLQGLLAILPDAVPQSLADLRPFVSKFVATAYASGRQPWEVALRFVTEMPGIETVIIGANAPEHIDSAVGVLHGEPLGPELRSEIEAIAQQVPPALLDPRTWPR